MTVKLNGRAYEYARRLISEGKFVFDGRDAWSEHPDRLRKRRMNLLGDTDSPNTGDGIWGSMTRKVSRPRDIMSCPTGILKMSTVAAS